MSRLLAGVALGAASAFILDPQQGRRRRALVRDKMARNAREGREFGEAAAKDLRARAQGAAAQLRAWRGGPVSDDVLVGRVRARLGRYVSHTHAVHVTARDGVVALTGSVLAAEHPSLVRALRMVSGVKDVDDRLDVHTSAQGISALQGGMAPSGQRPDLLQARWAPGTRALAGSTGALLVVYGLARGGLAGLAALAGGGALLTRAKVNHPLRSGTQRTPRSKELAST